MEDSAYLNDIAQRMCMTRFLNDTNARRIIAIFDAAKEEYDRLTLEEQRIVNRKIDEIM